MFQGDYLDRFRIFVIGIVDRIVGLQCVFLLLHEHGEKVALILSVTFGFLFLHGTPFHVKMSLNMLLGVRKKEELKDFLHVANAM